MSHPKWSPLSAMLRERQLAVDPAGSVRTPGGGSTGSERRTLDVRAPVGLRDGVLTLDGHAIQDQPVFSVTVGPVPCLAPVAAFGPWMSPEYWPRFVTGVDIEVLERHDVAGSGWRGTVLETLSFDMPGERLDLELHTVLAVDFRHGVDAARVDFSLVESREGVLTIDEGFIRAEPFLGGRGTHLWARKTIQLAPDAPQNLLAPFIPTMLRSILVFWLWEYSVNFMAERPQEPRDGDLPDLEPELLAQLGQTTTLVDR